MYSLFKSVEIAAHTFGTFFPTIKAQMCKNCGVYVIDAALHEEWHEQFGYAELEKDE